MITSKLMAGYISSPLSELSSNTQHLPYKHTTKRTLYAKKSINLKLQKAQLDHCCIDIVHRKPLSSCENTTQQKRGSNIQLLKKEIEYLQEDRLSWQKFPKEDILIKTAQLKTAKREEQPSPTIKVHSLDQIVSESSRSVLLEGLLNSFDRNFFIAPLERRPLTSDEKRARQYFTTGKKRSLIKCGPIDVSGFDKQNFRKTIHSKTDLSGPFRKFFAANRSRRNSSCGAQIVGRKMKRESILSLTTM